MKKIIGVMAVAMLLIGALIAPATAEVEAVNEGNSCPQSNGWVKVDTASGDETGDWGTLDWSGPTAEYDIELGYGLELCIKSGAKSGAHPDPWISGVLTGSGSVTTGEEIGGEEEQNISHVAYRISQVPIVCSDLVENADFPDRVVEEGEDPEEVCFEEDVPDDPLTLALVKAWDVDDEDDLWDEADASYTLTIDGEAFTGPVEVEDGDTVEIGETDVVVSEGCDFIGSDAGPIVVDAEDADEDGLITVTVTNTVECSAVLPGEPQEREPEVEPGEEEIETVQVEKKVEVLAEAEELPATGVPALVLALLGLLAVGSGGAILRRR